MTLVGVRTQNPAHLRRAFLQNSHDKIANEVRFSLGREMKKQASKRNVLTLVGKTEPSAQFFRWCRRRGSNPHEVALAGATRKKTSQWLVFSQRTCERQAGSDFVAVWPTGFESGLKIPKKKTGYPSLSGAEGGGRTLMKLPSRDFESRASAIPPLRQIFVERNHFSIKNFCLQAFFIQFSKKVDFLKKQKNKRLRKRKNAC